MDTNKGVLFDRKKELANVEVKKMEKLVSKAGRILLQIKTVYPFDFFPDEIIIDENQVRIIINQFFMTQHIESVLIKEIQTVTVETAPLFATITFSTLKAGTKPISIKFLKKDDALRARRMIQGLITVTKEGVDISKLSTSQLIDQVEKIGKVQV